MKSLALIDFCLLFYQPTVATTRSLLRQGGKFKLTENLGEGRVSKQPARVDFRLLGVRRVCDSSLMLFEGGPKIPHH